MRTCASGSRLVTLCAAALAASACATSGAPPPGPGDAAGGFTVSERVRAGASLRGDFARAVELLGQERYEAGIALLVAVTEAEPRLTAAHIDLGIAYGRTGDLERAKASLERALALNPRHPVAHNELGIVLRRLGRFAEARRSYERALELHPDFHFARRNLAILCDLYLADPDCALAHYELYARSVPADESATRWIADLRGRTER